MHYLFEIYIFKPFSEVDIFSKKNIVIFSNSKLDCDLFFNVKLISKSYNSKNLHYIASKCNVMHLLYSLTFKEDILINKNIMFFLISKLNSKHIKILNNIFCFDLDVNCVNRLLREKYFYIKDTLMVIIDNNWQATRQLILEYNFSKIIFYYNEELDNILLAYSNKKKQPSYILKFKNYLLK